MRHAETDDRADDRPRRDPLFGDPLVGHVPLGSAQRERARRACSRSVDVTLDVADRAITGAGSVEWLCRIGEGHEAPPAAALWSARTERGRAATSTVVAQPVAGLRALRRAVVGRGPPRPGGRAPRGVPPSRSRAAPAARSTTTARCTRVHPGRLRVGGDPREMPGRRRRLLVEQHVVGVEHRCSRDRRRASPARSAAPRASRRGGSARRARSPAGARGRSRSRCRPGRAVRVGRGRRAAGARRPSSHGRPARRSRRRAPAA